MSNKQTIEFFCPMVPPTKTHNDLVAYYNPKTKSPAIRKSTELHDVEDKLRAHFSKHRPEKPLAGAIDAFLTICYRADAKHPAGTLKTTKPDNDNLEKTIFDCLEREGFFAVGDQQIARNKTIKGYSVIPGIHVELREV